MASVESKLSLSRNEVYMMEIDSGYKRYYAFGKNLDTVFRKILRMYNSYCWESDFSVPQFLKICKEEEFGEYLYKVNTETGFCFDDDCHAVTDNDGAEQIGSFLEITDNIVKKIKEKGYPQKESERMMRNIIREFNPYGKSIRAMIADILTKEEYKKEYEGR